MPQWSRMSALVITVSATLGAAALALAHAVADHLAAAELHLLAVDGEVALDLDDQVGVGEAHAVAGGRAVHLGIGASRSMRLHGAAVERAHDLAAEAVHDARAGEGDQLDRAGLPGSKRTAVPAAMFRRKPRACGAVEAQRRVGLEEVVVRADLDRAVAGVGHRRARRWRGRR